MKDLMWGLGEVCSELSGDISELSEERLNDINQSIQEIGHYTNTAQENALIVAALALLKEKRNDFEIYKKGRGKTAEQGFTDQDERFLKAFRIAPD